MGCGGGLLCEPLSRLGGNVTGIDAADTNIEVAKIHMKKNLSLSVSINMGRYYSQTFGFPRES